jgi:tRNA pseudouridine-54 N-methylase
MAEIPNFPDNLLDLHHAWHQPGAHPGFPSRAIPPGQPGSGLEFFQFHRDFIRQFHAWYDSQPFADQEAVAEWTVLPVEVKDPSVGWNQNLAAQEQRITTNRPSFGSADALGQFVESGIHNWIHGAVAQAFGEPMVGTFHSPRSTLFYKIHGLVDLWWQRWTPLGFLLQTGTPISEADAAANLAFAGGDYDGDGRADLLCLKLTNTGAGQLEVHVLSAASAYQDFLLQTGTPISEADAAANFAFAAGDYNGDGRADLLCLKKTNTGTGQLEVHVLPGAANYQGFLLQTGTPISQADAAANFAFAAGDYNGDGRADLLCLKKTNTGTGQLEVHVLG